MNKTRWRWGSNEDRGNSKWKSRGKPSVFENHKVARMVGAEWGQERIAGEVSKGTGSKVLVVSQWVTFIFYFMLFRILQTVSSASESLLVIILVFLIIKWHMFIVKCQKIVRSKSKRNWCIIECQFSVYRRSWNGFIFSKQSFNHILLNSPEQMNWGEGRWKCPSQILDGYKCYLIWQI
jgi:hypothetical protein